MQAGVSFFTAFVALTDSTAVAPCEPLGSCVSQLPSRPPLRIQFLNSHSLRARALSPQWASAYTADPFLTLKSARDNKNGGGSSIFARPAKARTSLFVCVRTELQRADVLLPRTFRDRANHDDRSIFAGKGRAGVITDTTAPDCKNWRAGATATSALTIHAPPPNAPTSFPRKASRARVQRTQEPSRRPPASIRRRTARTRHAITLARHPAHRRIRRATALHSPRRAERSTAPRLSFPSRHAAKTRARTPSR